jgi:hypothetical protein
MGYTRAIHVRAGFSESIIEVFLKFLFAITPSSAPHIIRIIRDQSLITVPHPEGGSILTYYLEIEVVHVYSEIYKVRC